MTLQWKVVQGCRGKILGYIGKLGVIAQNLLGSCGGFSSCIWRRCCLAFGVLRGSMLNATLTLVQFSCQSDLWLLRYDHFKVIT